MFLYMELMILFSTSTELALPTLHDLIEHEEAFSKIHNNEMRLGMSFIPVFAMILPKDTAFFHCQCYFANTRSRAPMLNTTHNELGTSI